VVVGC